MGVSVFINNIFNKGDRRLLYRSVVDSRKSLLNYYDSAFVIGVSSEGGWHRIDRNEATITVEGSINTSLGKHAYFDDKPIYKDITTVSMSSLRPNQSVVKIPKFYYRRVGTGLTGDPYKLWVADSPLPGFSIHPAFMKNGSPIDYFYVGAYTCGGAEYDSQAETGCCQRFLREEYLSLDHHEPRRAD
jgi:hypothetical protein